METSSYFPLFVFVYLSPYWKSEPPFQCATPEKYSQQGPAIQGMQEVGLGLWICDFSLFFVRDEYNYKPDCKL
jgi:hypothetical protein